MLESFAGNVDSAVRYKAFGSIPVDGWGWWKYTSRPMGVVLYSCVLPAHMRRAEKAEKSIYII